MQNSKGIEDIESANVMIDKTEMAASIEDAIRTVHDPEIPVNIYELGLIYDIKIDDSANVLIKMTLTSPACPVAGSLPLEVQQKVQEIDGVNDATVQLVWDPPWTKDRMTDAARLELNMF